MMVRPGTWASHSGSWASTRSQPPQPAITNSSTTPRCSCARALSRTDFSLGTSRRASRGANPRGCPLPRGLDGGAPPQRQHQRGGAQRSHGHPAPAAAVEAVDVHADDHGHEAEHGQQEDEQVAGQRALRHVVRAQRPEAVAAHRLLEAERPRDDDGVGGEQRHRRGRPGHQHPPGPQHQHRGQQQLREGQQHRRGRAPQPAGQPEGGEGVAGLLLGAQLRHPGDGQQDGTRQVPQHQITHSGDYALPPAHRAPLRRPPRPPPSRPRRPPRPAPGRAARATPWPLAEPVGREAPRTVEPAHFAG